jgi:hypothetical protein
MENDIINILSIRKQSNDNFTDFITVVKFDLTINYLGATDTGTFEVYLGYPGIFENLEYTDYSNITESQIIEWVKNTPDYLQVRGDLEHKIWKNNQPEEINFPWTV